MDLNYQHILDKLEKEVLSLWSISGFSHKPKLKGSDDIVTETDLFIERELLKTLNNAAPDIPMLSEETHSELENCKTFFTIDPIDGTFNFSYGAPIYSTQVALVVDEKPVLGFMYFPELNYLFTAIEKKGAFLNHHPINVNSKKKISPLIAVTDYKRERVIFKLQAKLAREITLRVGKPRMTGCTSFDLAMVAAGHYQGKISLNPHLWDVAPGHVIIEEAGGISEYLPGEYFIGAASKRLYIQMSEIYDEITRSSEF